MKLKKIVLILFTILIIVCNWCVTAFSMNTGLSTNEMSIIDQQTFLSNIKLSLINDEPPKKAIVCFDVSNSGLIAIGSATSEKKHISVYNTTGEFQYGYVFNCNQSFGVQWDDTNLIIYFVRSDVAALFDSNGTSLELRVINNTTDNNSYWTHSVFSKEKIRNENIYTLKNDMGLFNAFASTYSQLVKTDSDGNKTIIYDVSKAQISNIIFVIIAISLFVAFVIFVVIFNFQQRPRSKNGTKGVY